jgi:MFS family permease
MRVKRQYVLVGCLAVCCFVIGGGVIAIVGPVFGPMMKDLGWSHERISILATTYTIGNLGSNPMVGIALDRFGARIVLPLGASAFAAGLLCASQSHSALVLIGCFALIGVGISAVNLPSTVVVTRSLPTRKGLGMGILMGAMAVGGTVFLPLVSSWIHALSWRQAMVRLAALTVVLHPMLWLCLRGEQSRMATRPIASATDSASPILGQLLSPASLFAALSGVLLAVGMLGIYYDVVELLVKAGYSPRIASLAFGSTWLVSGAGSLVFGFLADKFTPVRVLTTVILANACGTLFLFGTPEPRYGAICLVAFILLWGSSANGFNQLIPAVLVERFGPGRLGTIVGVQFALAGVAGSLAPILTGWLVDRSGNYRIAIAVSASVTLLSAVLASAIGFSKTSRGVPACFNAQ